MSLYEHLEQALLCCDALEKCALVAAIAADLLQMQDDEVTAAGWLRPSPLDMARAGQPARPRLVPARAVQTRKTSTPEGYAAMLHAIVHIEFNAINLALDAAYRFRRLPPQFCRDWVRVAAEEAQHFQLLRGRLQHWGFDYGDFDAHNHLWDMAYQTAFDPLLRMALVPRVLEARGLDVTPAIQAKITQMGDADTVAVLDVVYRDEIGHVAIGNHWYQYLCQQRGLDPVALFRQLIRRYDLFVFRGYVNKEARVEAGFSAFELSLLEDFEQSLHAQTTDADWRQALNRAV